MAPKEADPPTRRGAARWLAVLVVTYILLAITLSILRFQELQAGNWDLGIFQQAFWSTSHGHPFYEAGDYESYGVGSFLQIHPSLLMGALEPLYTLAPTPLTLFIVQAVVVGLAACPLYLLVEEVTADPKKALLAAGLYLLWPPILSANLSDFHLEAFVPLELFTFFLLWMRHRYLLGGAVALVAFATLEVTPFFIGFTALYFLLPPIRSSVRRAWSYVRGGTVPWRSEVLPALRRWAADAGVRASCLLLLMSALAYLTVEQVAADPGLVYLAPVLPAGSPPVANPSVGQLYVSLGHLPIDLPQKVGYWVLLYALLAFLPLRFPRTQLIVLPWLVYTFLGHETFTVLGFQYGFLPAYPLFIGLAYGLKDLPLIGVREAIVSWWAARTWVRPSPSGAARASPIGNLRPPRPLLGSAGWTLLILVVVIAAGLLSPADPLVQDRGLQGGYEVSYLPGAGFAAVQALASQVPAGATVLASDNLFPLVANDVNAYALMWTPMIPPYLPFSPSDLPPYVLLEDRQLFAVPGWLQLSLNSSTTYVVQGTVSSSPVGPVTLYVWTGAAGALPTD